MPKIKIKPKAGPSASARVSLLSLLQNLEIDVTRYIDLPDGYVAMPEDETNLKKILEGTTISSLDKAGFSVIIPLDMKAKLTLVMKKMDNSVMNATPEQIKQSIELKNPTVKVSQIYKIDKINMIKVQFQDHTTADKIKANGIKFMNLSVTKDMIEYERFTYIKQCFTCYSYDHYKANCPNKNVKWCSECGARNHTYTTCKSKYQRCLNCDGPHRTLANSCHHRKRAVERTQRENEEKEREKEAKPMTVAVQKAAAAAITAQTQAWQKETSQIKEKIDRQVASQSPKILLQIPQGTPLKVATIIATAHIQHIVDPSVSFQNHVTKLCISNNIEQINVGYDNPNSWGILQLIPPSTQHHPPQSRPHPDPQPAPNHAHHSIPSNQWTQPHIPSQHTPRGQALLPNPYKPINPPTQQKHPHSPQQPSPAQSLFHIADHHFPPPSSNLRPLPQLTPNQPTRSLGSASPKRKLSEDEHTDIGTPNNKHRRHRRNRNKQHRSEPLLLHAQDSNNQVYSMKYVSADTPLPASLLPPSPPPPTPNTPTSRAHPNTPVTPRETDAMTSPSKNKDTQAKTLPNADTQDHTTKTFDQQTTCTNTDVHASKQPTPQNNTTALLPQHQDTSHGNSFTVDTPSTLASIPPLLSPASNSSQQKPSHLMVKILSKPDNHKQIQPVTQWRNSSSHLRKESQNSMTSIASDSIPLGGSASDYEMELSQNSQSSQPALEPPSPDRRHLYKPVPSPVPHPHNQHATAADTASSPRTDARTQRSSNNKQTNKDINALTYPKDPKHYGIVLHTPAARECYEKCTPMELKNKIKNKTREIIYTFSNKDYNNPISKHILHDMIITGRIQVDYSMLKSTALKHFRNGYEEAQHPTPSPSPSPLQHQTSDLPHSSY